MNFDWAGKGFVLTLIQRSVSVADAVETSPGHDPWTFEKSPRRAKVSTATVSRTINRVPTVDPALAKRVMKVVEDMGYYPNTAARALVSGKSRIFGLIVSEITNPFFPEIVQAFEDIAVQNHYEILLTSTVHDPKRMELAVRRMIERRVDGVAILTFGMEEALVADLRFRKVPLVFVDVGPQAAGITNIRVNYQQGIREAVRHLAKLGHKRIAFVAGPTNLKSAMARRAAFEAAMQENGLHGRSGIDRHRRSQSGRRRCGDCAACGDAESGRQRFCARTT